MFLEVFFGNIDAARGINARYATYNKFTLENQEIDTIQLNMPKNASFRDGPYCKSRERERERVTMNRVTMNTYLDLIIDYWLLMT